MLDGFDPPMKVFSDWRELTGIGGLVQVLPFEMIFDFSSFTNGVEKFFSYFTKLQACQSMVYYSIYELLEIESSILSLESLRRLLEPFTLPL